MMGYSYISWCADEAPVLATLSFHRVPCQRKSVIGELTSVLLPRMYQGAWTEAVLVWHVGGTEVVDSAIYGQSLLTSGLRHARGKEGI